MLSIVSILGRLALPVILVCYLTSPASAALAPLSNAVSQHETRTCDLLRVVRSRRASLAPLE